MRPALISLVCVFAGCSSFDSSSLQSQDLVAQRLDEADFRYVSQVVAEGANRVYYKVYQYDAGSQSYNAIRGGRFDGMLLARDIDNLIALPDGTNTDGRFNKILLEPAETRTGETAIVSVTGTADGTIVMAVETDVSRNGVALAGILKDKEFFVVLGEFEGLRELPCMDQSAFRGSLLGILQCAGLTSPGGGGGDGGGDAGDRLLEDMGGLLGEPDCDSDKLGPVTQQRGRQTPEYWRRRADHARQMRNYLPWGTPDPQHVAELNSRYERLEAARLELANRTQRLDEAESNPLTPEDELRKAIIKYKQALAAERRAERAVEEQREKVNANSTSPIVPPGVDAPEGFEDPRCAGRGVDANRGTLFTNSEFCGGEDPISCIIRQRDSLFGLTDGQCWSESGPDDARHIVCGPAERFPGRAGSLTPDEIPRPTECPPDDIDCWTDPVGPTTTGGSVAVRYVDLTPLGELLAVICAQVGCPET